MHAYKVETVVITTEFTDALSLIAATRRVDAIPSSVDSTVMIWRAISSPHQPAHFLPYVKVTSHITHQYHQGHQACVVPSKTMDTGLPLISSLRLKNKRDYFGGSTYPLFSSKYLKQSILLSDTPAFSIDVTTLTG